MAFEITCAWDQVWYLGSRVRFEAAHVEHVSQGTAYFGVFLPECQGASGALGRCDLTNWAFEADVEIPGFDEGYASYPLDLFKAMSDF